MQLGHSLLRKPLLHQFGIHLVEPHLVEFVDGHSNVDNLLGSPYPLGYTAQYLTVVQLDGYPYAQTGEYLVDHLDELYLVQQRVGAHHVGIALVELAITPLLRTVGPPHGLNLITLEGEGKFVAVHHHKAGKGHGEVVTEPLLAQAGSQAVEIALGQVGLRNIREEIARVEHLEEQLVTLLAIFAHEGLQGLHGRRLNLPEPIESKNLFYRIEYVIALGHLVDREIARTFGNGRFCHHIFHCLFYVLRGESSRLQSIPAATLPIAGFTARLSNRNLSGICCLRFFTERYSWFFILEKKAGIHPPLPSILPRKPTTGIPGHDL